MTTKTLCALTVTTCLFAATQANAALILDVSHSNPDGFTTTAYNGATGSITMTGPETPVAGLAGGTGNVNNDNSWESNTGGPDGYNNSTYFFSRVGDASGGDSTVVWEFTGLTSGTYSVHVFYEHDTNRSTDAPFEIFDGTAAGTPLVSTPVNQRLAPDDLTVDDGQGTHSWEALASSVTITGNTLSVRLTNEANSGNDNFVIADAVRIVEVIPEPSSLALLGLGGLLVARRRRHA